MTEPAPPADPRLGRLPSFDERSRSYPIRELVEGSAPRSYTWSCYARLDQLRQSSCVGHAFAHELAARPVVVPDVDHPLAVALYYDAQHRDEWDGGDWPGAQPHFEGTSVLAGAKACTARGYYTEYRWGFSESDVALAVGYRGPVVVGTEWTRDMMAVDHSGFLRPTGPVAGGHAWLIYSVDVKRSFYRMLNSWGPGWGDNGTAKISREDLAALLARDGDACLPMRKAR